MCLNSFEPAFEVGEFATLTEVFPDGKIVVSCRVVKRVQYNTTPVTYLLSNGNGPWVRAEEHIQGGLIRCAQ